MTESVRCSSLATTNRYEDEKARMTTMESYLAEKKCLLTVGVLLVAVLRGIVVVAVVWPSRVSSATHPFWNVRLRFLLEAERSERGSRRSASTLGRAVPCRVSARAEVVVDVVVVKLAFTTSSLQRNARVGGGGDVAVVDGLRRGRYRVDADDVRFVFPRRPCVSLAGGTNAQEVAFDLSGVTWSAWRASVRPTEQLERVRTSCATSRKLRFASTVLVRVVHRECYEG